MKKSPSFHEIQTQKQWWTWAILIATAGFMVFGCYRQVVMGITFGDNPASNTWLIIVTVLVVLVIAAMLLLKLDTFIDKNGVYVRFLPFQRNYKFYDWKSVASYEVRKYNPALEYGGWGYRYRSGKKIAYSMNGRIGLQLTFLDGKIVMIGTQKQEEMLHFLNQLKEESGIKTIE